MAKPTDNHAAAAALQQQARQAASQRPSTPVKTAQPKPAESSPDDGLDIFSWDYDASKFFGFDRKSHG